MSLCDIASLFFFFLITVHHGYKAQDPQEGLSHSLSLYVCVCMCVGSSIISMRVVRPEITDPDERLLDATDVAMVTSCLHF